VIAVTAVDRESRIYSRATRGDYIALAAPGVRLRTVTPRGGDTARSGTSFAVPYVRAAAATLLARNSGLDHADIIHLLSVAARDLGAPGRDPVYGWGLLQTAGICDWPRAAPMPTIAGDMTPARPTAGSIRKGLE
jgi:subtilisin family serine protease